MKRVLGFFLVLVCARVGAEELNRYEMFVDWQGTQGNGVANVVLRTPRKEIQLNAFASAGALIPISTAVMINQGMYMGNGEIFDSYRGLTQGQRNITAAGTSVGGLVTTSIGLRFNILAEKKAPKPADPVGALEKSDLFPLLQKEFGAQKARDLIFARMVEGWSFRRIADKFFKEPLRSKAVKMANEEYDLLSGDKAKFGTNLREQEAAIDAKVGQIVMLRIALEAMKDGEEKQAVQETIEFVRSEHKNAPSVEVGTSSPETNAVHTN